MENEMSKKIKRLRLENNMTLEQVAHIVGVGKSTVRKWETGAIANMGRDKIALLAKALNTSPSYLMGWKEENDLSFLNSHEQAILSVFRALNKEDRQKLIAYAYDLKKEASKGMTTVKFAARDGTYKELQLTDEQLQELIKKAEALEDAPDDL